MLVIIVNIQSHLCDSSPLSWQQSMEFPHFTTFDQNTVWSDIHNDEKIKLVWGTALVLNSWIEASMQSPIYPLTHIFTSNQLFVHISSIYCYSNFAICYMYCPYIGSHCLNTLDRIVFPLIKHRTCSSSRLNSFMSWQM